LKVLRTPDERFADLPGWGYAPRYLDDLHGYEGLRMHYVDLGPREAQATFVCLHGEPTWSYLYRKMIPVFLEAGHRVIAPDFFGFGRSDKPADDETYSFAFHRDALKRFLERFDLSQACLVVQDWGGLLGLTVPMDYPERVTRLLVMNTGLGTGRSAGPGFDAWRAIFLATLSNLLFKIVAASFLGSPELRKWMLGTGAIALTAGMALLLLWP